MASRKFLGFIGGVGIGYSTYCMTSHNTSFSSGLGMGHLYYQYGGIFQKFVDGETGHVIAVRACALPLFFRKFLGLVDSDKDDPSLRVKQFDLDFVNPVGIAAGFDKNGQAMDGILGMGFGFAEVGSVTPLPQPGNPKPRVFRLVEDKCVINRYGFNSDGVEVVKKRLEVRHKKIEKEDRKNGIVGVNLGKNKTTQNAADDYVKGVQQLGQFADYLVINVSSPNTPGLRALQGKQILEDLLTQVKIARDKLPNVPPLLVKIAPDLTSEDKKRDRGGRYVCKIRRCDNL